MPYLKDKNILFIHIPKTAGMYIAKYIGVNYLKYYSSYQPTVDEAEMHFKDLLHPAETEEVQSGQFRKWIKKIFEKEVASQQIADTTSVEELIGQTTISVPMQTMSAAELIRFGYISQDDFIGATKIVSVRDPLARFRSLVAYWKFDRVGFSVDWVIENCLRHPNYLIPKEIISSFSSQLSMIHTHHANIEDWHIIKTESVDRDIQHTTEKIGLPYISQSKEKFNVSDSESIHLSSEQISIIKNFYKSDYLAFDYEY